MNQVLRYKPSVYAVISKSGLGLYYGTQMTYKNEQVGRELRVIRTVPAVTSGRILFFSKCLGIQIWQPFSSLIISVHAGITIIMLFDIR